MSEYSRRLFLRRGAILGVASAFAPATELTAATTPNEPWLRGLNGKHRQIFDVSSAREGALRRAGNYLDTYVETYKLRESDINLLIGVHGAGLPLVFADAIWAKYKLGARSGAIDPATKAPSVRNPFYRFESALGWVSDYSIVTLQRRGVRFLGCNNTLRSLVRELSNEAGIDAAAVATELRANILPGVVMVPAMVVAMDRAQEEGLSYAYIAG